MSSDLLSVDLLEQASGRPDSLDVAAVDARIRHLTTRLCRRVRASYANIDRADALRMESYDYLFHLDGEQFAQCPEVNGVRYPSSWRAEDRAMWNHCYHPRPSLCPRRFLERFELPSGDAHEWAAPLRYREMLSLPLVSHGVVWGKVVAFTEARGRDARRPAHEVAPLLAALTPLVLYRNLVRDLRRATEGNPGELAGRRTVEFLDLAVRVGALSSLGENAFLPRAARRACTGLVARKPSLRFSPRPLVRTVLALGDPISLRGLSALVSESMERADRTIHVAAYAGAGRDALSICRRHRPDLVLVDTRAETSIPWRLFDRLALMLPGTAILVLLERASAPLVRQLSAAGIKGCVLGSRIAAELGDACRAAVGGRTFYGRGVRDLVSVEAGQPALTMREIEVLRSAAAGHSAKQIAAQCSISVHTANFHLQNAYPKLGARTRAEAVSLAIRAGLI